MGPPPETGLVALGLSNSAIHNLLENPDKGMPIVNDTTYREVASELMQFGISFPHILQAI